ncbi:MAG: PTS sugar transporter subunit IIA [Myxococcales bacterium]|nr:PTS sugar transporter subunit IIA [Myxococcales bacterium]
MRIAEFLREDLVFPDLAASDKAGALGELCAGLAKAYPALNTGRLTEVLLEREKLGSTGIGEGVAIPHGKLPGIPGLIAAFARSQRGVDFASIDGKPTFLFFVLFAPENSAGLHLKALARISRLFKQPQFRQSIQSADGAPAIFRLISEEDAKY